ALERLIFAVVPHGSRLLHDARAMAYHAFDEIVRHREPDVGPRASLTRVARRENDDDDDRREEQGDVEHALRAACEHDARHDDLDERKHGHEAPAEAERLDGGRLDHATEELPRALVTDLVRRESKRADEKAHLEQD